MLESIYGIHYISPHRGNVSSLKNISVVLLQLEPLFQVVSQNLIRNQFIPAASLTG